MSKYFATYLTLNPELDPGHGRTSHLTHSCRTHSQEVNRGHQHCADATNEVAVRVILSPFDYLHRDCLKNRWS